MRDELNANRCSNVKRFFWLDHIVEYNNLIEAYDFEKIIYGHFFSASF